MRVLVTGGAGYIGSVLVPHLLLAHHHDVTVLDDFRYNQTPFAALCHRHDLDIVRGDARNMSVVRELLKTADAIIPLAAIVGAPACEKTPNSAVSINRDAVSCLIRELSPNQVVLYPNTNSGYGIGGTKACTEESPMSPVSLYGRTKCEAEAYVLEHKNSVVLRLATVFGPSPRMRTDLMVNDFVRKAIHHGSLELYQPDARRNFIHVRDVASAFSFMLGLIGDGDVEERVYNCGDDLANMTKGALCDLIAHHVPGFTWSVVGGEDPDKRDYLVSNDRINATGWEPQYTIEDGIRHLINYYTQSLARCGNV